MEPSPSRQLLTFAARRPNGGVPAAGLAQDWLPRSDSLSRTPGAPMGDSGAETRPFTETEEDSSRTRRLGPLKIPGDNRLQRLHSVTDNPGLLPGASQPAWQPPPGRGGAAGQGGRGLSATESGVDRKRSTTVAYAKQTKAYAFESVKASIRIQRGRKEDFDINRARSHTETRTVVRARAIERPSSFDYWNLSPSVFNSDGHRRCKGPSRIAFR